MNYDILFYIMTGVIAIGVFIYSILYALLHKNSPSNNEKNNESTSSIQVISGRRTVYLTGEEHERAIAEYLLKAKCDYESGLSAAREEGRKDSQKDVALKMLVAGLPPEKITLFSGLSSEEIVNIERELKA